MVKEKGLEAGTQKRAAKMFCCSSTRSAMPMPIPAGSAAGTQDLQRTASIHEQMKLKAADVSTPIPRWGPGPRREACCPEVPRPIFPWSCNPSRPQPNSWLDLLFSAAAGVWSPVDGAPNPAHITESSVLASGLISQLLAYYSPETAPIHFRG